MSGILSIVATPLGNLEDMTLRAIRILKECDVVVAEDSRRTRPLLSHFGIEGKEIISFFEHSHKGRQQHIINYLKAGRHLALVSDAGTPTLSDPGARLVAACYDEKIQVVPIPGASALLTALSVSGFPTEPLHFWGFLSPSPQKRRKVYRTIVDMQGVHAFYASPHKLHKLAQEWKDFFPDWYFFVGREMTKKFEEYKRGTCPEVCDSLLAVEPRGEYTVLLVRELLKTGHDDQIE